jgi:hypothetical protein
MQHKKLIIKKLNVPDPIRISHTLLGESESTQSPENLGGLGRHSGLRELSSRFLRTLVEVVSLGQVTPTNLVNEL